MTKDTKLNKELLSQIDDKRIPAHIAVIMDGNGRWAKSKGYRDRIKGHQYATKAVREAIKTSAELGVDYLSLFAFSTENWSRPQKEISALMLLLEKFIKSESQELIDNNIRVVVSGRKNDLPQNVRILLNDVLEKTSQNTGLTVNICLSYSGKSEIVDAVNKIIKRAKDADIEITEQTFREYLYHPEIPDPDLLVRTSGELRISNYFLWQMAYTEIYITDILWPDFEGDNLLEAIIDYQGRDRRFGRVD